MLQETQTQKLTVTLSKTALHFKNKAHFEVTVSNHSDEFTSFQLELLAAGADPKADNDWYQLKPSVSYKIPPGDRTQFQVEIIDVPPIRGGMGNSINLVVRVDAIELGLQERRDLTLLVEGSPIRPLQMTLSANSLQVYPGDRFEIAVDVANSNSKPAEVLLELLGVDSRWHMVEMKQATMIPAGGSATIYLAGHLPDPVEVPQRDYVLSVDAAPRSPTPVVPATVVFTVLPKGHLQAAPLMQQQQFPAKAGRWINPRHAKADLPLTFQNQSNCELTVTATLQDPDTRLPRPTRRPFWPWQQQHSEASSQGRGEPNSQTEGDLHAEASEPQTEAAVAALSRTKRTLTLEPTQTVLAPGDETELTVQVSQPLPWLGWKRVKSIQVLPNSNHPTIEHQILLPPHPVDEPQADEPPETAEQALSQPTPALPAEFQQGGAQILELHILPVIPLWLQSIGTLLLLLMAIAPILLAQRGHTNTVNAVQFSGRANEVVSAADDTTIRRWVVRGDRLKPAGVLHRGDKAVRVVRYRPVNNDQIAAGFENGSLLLHDFLDRRSSTFGHQPDDRVFDLAFTRDSRYLFSAHGSGLILQWQADAQRIAAKPTQGIEVDFAAQAVGVVGERDQFLAIAGRYNQLTLFHRDREEFHELAYMAGGGQNDYITSLVTTHAYPTRFATADMQGRIALWDLEHCASNPSGCQAVDEWQGHGGAAVYDLALSPDGCYLASVGENGEVVVWPLTARGLRQSQALEGKSLLQVKQPLNAVDLIQPQNHLLVVSGGNDTQVRLRRIRLGRDRSSKDQCRGL